MIQPYDDWQETNFRWIKNPSHMFIADSNVEFYFCEENGQLVTALKDTTPSRA